MNAVKVQARVTTTGRCLGMFNSPMYAQPAVDAPDMLMIGRKIYLILMKNQIKDIYKNPVKNLKIVSNQKLLTNAVLSVKHVEIVIVTLLILSRPLVSAM